MKIKITLTDGTIVELEGEDAVAAAKEFLAKTAYNVTFNKEKILDWFKNVKEEPPKDENEAWPNVVRPEECICSAGWWTVCPVHNYAYKLDVR